jgi:predicted solute-binding protein
MLNQWMAAEWVEMVSTSIVFAGTMCLKLVAIPASALLTGTIRVGRSE